MEVLDVEKELSAIRLPTGEIIAEKVSIFHKILNTPPKKQFIKRIPYAPADKKGNYPMHLEIGYILTLLDSFFLGNWSTKNVKTETVYRSQLVTLELEYFHPVYKKTLTRVGVAAEDLAIDAKGEIKNKSLQKVIGKAKSTAIKNAAKEIGLAFGRGLNKDFQPIYKEMGGVHELF